MPKYVAFLRAINVGGHTVKMDALKRLFEKMGFENISTFIASGNVIFESSAKGDRKLEISIEKSLKEALGYEVATFVRSIMELTEIVELSPFEKRAGGSVYIGFLEKEPSASTRKKVLTYKSKIDDFFFRGREIYWQCLGRMMESKFSGALLEKTAGMPITLRNLNTVRKISDKYG